MLWQVWGLLLGRRWCRRRLAMARMWWSSLAQRSPAVAWLGLCCCVSSLCRCCMSCRRRWRSLFIARMAWSPFGAIKACGLCWTSGVNEQQQLSAMMNDIDIDLPRSRGQSPPPQAERWTLGQPASHGVSHEWLPSRCITQQEQQQQLATPTMIVWQLQVASSTEECWRLGDCAQARAVVAA